MKKKYRSLVLVPVILLCTLFGCRKEKAELLFEDTEKIIEEDPADLSGDSEENQKAIQDCTKDVDAEDLLIQELQLLTAREAFLLQRISAVQEKKQHIQSVHTSKSSRSFTRLDEDKEKEAHDKEVYIERIDAKVSREERLPGTTVETSTTVESSYLIVERLERLLTDVQRQKSKVIQQLADLRRMSNSGKNELVDDWVAAVEAADTEAEDADDGTETT